MAYVFSDPQNNLAQVAYASNISSTSHQSVFPDFLRTYPSSSYEGYALADTISTYFKLTRVVLIYTSGLYGTDGATEFLTAAAHMRIDVVKAITMDPFEVNFPAFLDGLEIYDARIFVLIMSNINQAGAMMLYASQVGLINDQTLVFGTSSLASSVLWTSVTSDATVAAKMMRGFFTTANADNDWKVSPRGIEFIKRYRAQPNTLGHTKASGVHVCNNATDDDGGYSLYQASLNNLPPYNCIGFNFSAFAADGYVHNSLSSCFGMFWYDLLCYVLLCNVFLCFVLYHHVMYFFVIFCCVLFCFVLCCVVFFGLLCLGMFFYVVFCFSMSCYFILRCVTFFFFFVMFCYVKFSYVFLCFGMFCYVMFC